VKKPLVLALTVFALSACRDNLPPLSPVGVQMRKAVMAIATPGEVRAFDRAVRTSADSIDAFMERFWKRRDPTPETPRNEYKERFMARLTIGAADLFPAGVPADDRLAVYILNGAPTKAFPTSITSHPPHPEILRAALYWLWDLPAEIWLHHSNNPALDSPIYSLRFEEGDTGGFEWDIGSPAFPRYPKIKRLSVLDIRTLTKVLADTTRMPAERAVAAWRLGIDPAPAALAALMSQLNNDQPQISAMVARGLRPLVLVQLAQGGEKILVSRPADELSRIETFTGPEGATMEKEKGSAAPHDSLEVSPVERLLAEVYDPAATVPSSELGELRRLAEEAKHLPPQDRGWLTMEEAARLYLGPLKDARDLIDGGYPLAAHELLEPLLQTSLVQSAEAWHLDALALAESGSPGGRRMAEDRARKALRLDPGNVRYRLTLADILSRRTLDVYADQNLDRVIDEHPGAADAYALKARLRLQVLWNIGWRAGGWGTDLPGSSNDAYALQAYALEMLGRALIIYPESRFGGWWLGTHYVFKEAYEEVIPVMTYLINHRIHLAEAYLGRGLALQSLGYHDLAMADYLAGREELPAQAKALLDNAAWVLAPSEGGVAVTGASAVIPLIEPGTGERFWRAKDPLFSSALNERLMEQYRRFAFATWNFANPQLGLKGWETQRGRIYLRYGHPNVDPYNAWSAGVRSASWDYGGFRIRFRIGMVTGNWRVNNEAELAQYVEDKPDAPTVVGGREVNEIEAAWYRFRDPGGSTILIPVAHLRSEHIHGLIPGKRPTDMPDLPITLILLDKEWRECQRVSETMTAVSISTMSPSRTWVGSPVAMPRDMDFQPAYAALEIVPEGEGPALAARDSLEGVGEGPLQLSSLVLGTTEDSPGRPEEAGYADILERGGIRIVPRPNGTFGRGEAVFLFFEIYGLTRDDVGATSYRIAVTTTSMTEEAQRPPLMEALGRLIGREEKEGRITLTFDRMGIRETEQISTQIVFPADVQAHCFILMIEIQDLVGERSVASTVSIEVY
jgi:GWxTD domain-containing protein